VAGAGRIEFLGDCSLLVRFGDAPDAAINQRVHACAAALHRQAPGWLVDITPSFASLALHLDPSRIDGDDPLAAAREWLEGSLVQVPMDAPRSQGRRVDIPVQYGGEHGPDLADVAAHAGISIDAAIERHAGADYLVAMLGFAPGFPYLLGLHASLAMPRLSTPRQRVAAGSVGIGGAQTGIYPNAGPGGWRLIGRTPLRLFDALREPPSLLMPGDSVRFVAIDLAAFDAMQAHAR